MIMILVDIIVIKFDLIGNKWRINLEAAPEVNSNRVTAVKFTTRVPLQLTEEIL